MNKPVLLPAALLALLWAGASVLGDEQPQLVPTKDVDISYDVSWPQQPKTRERRRWRADGHLQRVDGADGSSSIFDATRGEITLLNSKTRSFYRLEGTPRRPADPRKGQVVTRGGEATVAGLHCVEWSWSEDVETHTVCTTPDGVLLRLIVDGQVVMQARSVAYGPQAATLFQVPAGWSPALAPEGANEP